jgi:hypothetical protein
MLLTELIRKCPPWKGTMGDDSVQFIEKGHLEMIKSSLTDRKLA